MSTAADVAPYLQAWLDARAPVTTAQTNFNNAKAAVETARGTLQTAVTSGGKTAAQAQTELQNWISALGTYVTADAALNAARATLDAARARAESMATLCAEGGVVPVFTP